MDKLAFIFRYLFSVRPDPNFQYTKMTLLVALLLVVVALAIHIWRKKFMKDEILRRLMKRYPMPLLSFAMALLSLLAFRELGFPIFSMRIWWLGLGLLFIIWIFKIAFGFRKEYQERKEHHGLHSAKSKYLPKKKKR